MAFPVACVATVGDREQCPCGGDLAWQVLMGGAVRSVCRECGSVRPLVRVYEAPPIRSLGRGVGSKGKYIRTAVGHRTCAVCTTPFSFIRRNGQPRETCSEACAKAKWRLSMEED